MANLKLDPKASLNAEAQIISDVAAAKAALLIFDGVLTTNWDMCHPSEAIAAAQAEISGAADLSDLAGLEQTIANLTAGGTQARRNAVSQTRAAFDDSASALATLKADCLALLTAWQETALAAELQFFATDWGQPNQVTSVSSRYAACINAVNAATKVRDGAAPNDWTLPNPLQQPMLTWLLGTYSLT